MSESFVFSKTLPLFSIINPDYSSSNFLDVESPFSYFDFLKYTKGEFSPLQFNDLYVLYLKKWHEIKQSIDYTSNTLIHDRYVELLKEITIKHTTLEEKRFLTNVDFSDDTDLDIIIQFYSKKLVEICDFYSDKREKLKFKIEKNKIKGTSSSIEKSIYDNILDILFSDELEVVNYQKIVSKDDILNNLNIEIEELYDIYTNYFDNNPQETYSTYDVKSDLRKTLYSSNINDIDYNLFINIDKSIVESIFKNVRVFLKELGKKFTINYNFDSVNLNCKPDEKLYKLITENKDKSSRLVDLKKRLIKKYIGSDFYYIQTGSTTTVQASGVLFKADNPTGNLLNRHFPTTATIEEESDLQSCRKIGLFFTPEKNSILYYSVPEKTYKIDSSKLEPNKVYIFPDPEKYGNTVGLTRTMDKEYPLIHICDYTNSVKSQSHGYSEGDIDSSPYNQDFYSYFSKNQLSDNYILGKEGLKNNFSSIYNEGILCKWTTDIYGNQFGLFKYKPKKKYVDNSFTIETKINECEEYDGGPITFYENGLLPEVIIASNSSWVKNSVWQSDYFYNVLLEGGIGGIVNGLMERGVYDGGYVVDGLYVDRNKITTEMFDIDLNPLSSKELAIIDGNYILKPIGFTDDWSLNDTSGFTSTYDRIIDGQFYCRIPANNLKDTPNNTLDGNPPLANISPFTPSFNNQYILSSIKYKEFNAGNLSELCETQFNFEDQSKFIINETLIASKTLLETYENQDVINSYDIKQSFGDIYVKDVVTGDIKTLSSSLIKQFKKYDSSIYNDLRYNLYNNLIDFNIYNDFLWIRTNEYFVYEKILYSDGEYNYSGTGLNYIKYGDNDICEITDPFIFENRDYSMSIRLSGYNTNSTDFSIIPTFYKIYYNDCKIESILTTEDADFYKNNSSKNPIKIKRINKPVLTYNSRNRKYCVMTTIEDMNELAYIYQIKFEYDGLHIINMQVRIYNFDDTEAIFTLDINSDTFFSNGLILSNNISGNTNTSFNNDILILS